MTDYQDVSTTQHEEGHEQRTATFKATQLVWLFLAILEALIAFRIVFKFIAVNPSNLFAAMVYNLSNFFVAPFESLIGAPASGAMVLEISSLIAMVVYFLIAWAIERILYVLFYRSRGPVSTRQTTRTDRAVQPQVTSSATQTTVTDRIDTRNP